LRDEETDWRGRAAHAARRIAPKKLIQPPDRRANRRTGG
jgi:hypothetical protein